MLFFSAKTNPYLEDPDVVLMMAFKSGDQSAFESIMKRNYTKIFSFIYRMIANQASAEDLTQEVFVKLYGLAPTYEPRAKLSTLLFQIARNGSLNYLKAQKHHVTLDSSSDFEQIEDTAQERLEKLEKYSQIQAAIQALPENQRTAVLLRRFEDMSYEEIAKTMNISPQAVKSLLNRAKEQLRVFLKEIL